MVLDRCRKPSHIDVKAVDFHVRNVISRIRHIAHKIQENKKIYNDILIIYVNLLFQYTYDFKYMQVERKEYDKLVKEGENVIPMIALNVSTGKSKSYDLRTSHNKLA